jgi:tetratricopeptide (TPR) repeat protein
LRLRQHRPDQALADLDQAARLRPDAPEVYTNMARVHEYRKDWKAAETALSRGLQRRDDPALYHARARARLRGGDKKAARGDLEQAIAREPAGSRSTQLLDALVELGHLKHRAGEHRAALTDFDMAIRLSPDYAPAHRQRAETLRALELHAEAGAALDRCLACGVRDPKVHLVRGLIHTRLGEDEAAIRSYHASLQLKEDAQARGELGWAYLQMDAPRLALAQFTEAMRLGPATSRVRCGRALAHVKLGQGSLAVQDAEAALTTRDTSGPDAPLLAACVHARAARLALSALRTRGRTRPGAGSEDRAAELVVEALRRVPLASRATFWRTRVMKEDALAEVRRHPKVAHLARQFEQ